MKKRLYISSLILSTLVTSCDKDVWHKDNNINDSEERNSWTITLWESKKDLQKREYVKITPAL